MTAFDSAFQAAAAMGITVCVASGDNGSSDGVNDGADHVDFPASSPNVLACGGTRLQASGTTITGESVWNDGDQGGAGGGGVSGFFAVAGVAKWVAGDADVGRQQRRSTMRGVPDVSGDADPESGYDVRIDGTDTVIGGTSAVAPLWAGLIARINSTRGTPVGYINPQLYAAPSGFQRHHVRQQRNLCGGIQMGCLHRARQPGRDQDRRLVPTDGLTSCLDLRSTASLSNLSAAVALTGNSSGVLCDRSNHKFTPTKSKPAQANPAGNLSHHR